MKIDTINLSGKKTSIEVLDKIFSAKINKQLVSNVIYKINSNYKGRKAKTKQRNEISGSTAKIWAQKGTGNARHSSRKAPIFVGGGVAHGPKGESKYKIRKLNKSEKKNSLASLITEKKLNNNVIIFSDFTSKIIKTKEMKSILVKFDILNGLIVLDKISKENVYKSLRNISNIKTTNTSLFSAYDIVKYKKLIFTESSVKELEKRF